jgi:hypothetical protein
MEKSTKGDKHTEEILEINPYTLSERNKMSTPKYNRGDMVIYKMSKNSNRTYYGVVVSNWRAQYNKNLIIYEIAALNDSMRSYSLGERYIVQKVD